MGMARRAWVVAALNVVGMIPLLHTDLTWTRTLVGWLTMIPLYGVIVGVISLTLRPLDDGWRLMRRARRAAR